MRAGRSDRGAVAVEFAILFPIFIALALGTITMGTALYRDIALTNATREAARFGATLQISNTTTAGSVTQDQWLTKVAEISIRSAGWALPSNLSVTTPTLPARLTDNGAVCVAYVRGAEGQVFPTRSLTFARNSLVGTFASTPCLAADGVPAGTYDPKRVQVVMERNAMFEAVDTRANFLLKSRSVLTYERGQT